MAYRKIPNLYKDKRILEFKRVYAMEKIHGSTWWITYDSSKKKPFSVRIRGADYELGIRAFDLDSLEARLSERFDDIRIYGEGYGGRMQGMSNTYGKEMRFVAFDVLINGVRLSVPDAHELCASLGLDFVHYELIDTSIESVNAARDLPSQQAIKLGMGDDKESEGVVLRPPFEVRTNNGFYLVAKHKKDKFRETKTVRPLSEEELKILEEAAAIAEEWVTPERLRHVAQKLEANIAPENIPLFIRGMCDDIKIEADGEIVWTKNAQKAISRKTACMVKDFVRKELESYK